MYASGTFAGDNSVYTYCMVVLQGVVVAGDGEGALGVVEIPDWMGRQSKQQLLKLAGVAEVKYLCAVEE